MAIKETDNFESSLYSNEFSTAGAPTIEVMTQVTDNFNANGEKTDIIIYASGLDADTQVTFKAGNSLISNELADMLDVNGEAIVISVSNGTTIQTVNINSFVVGFYFEKLTATTGTVKVLARL